MPILDLHAHFSSKPAHSRNFTDRQLPDPDHWNERLKHRHEWSRLVAAYDGEVVKTSQIHGNAATAGGFGVIVNALYPIEHGFTSKLLNRSLSVLSGYAQEVLDDLYERRISNFQMLEREYHNLILGQNRTALSAQGNRYKVVDSFTQLESALSEDPRTICIVNSIEGAHAFADNFFDRRGYYVGMHKEEARFLRRTGTRDGSTWFELYIEGILTNIDRVKSAWEHTPFFVTFAHHYYNHLCGHAPSLTHLVALMAGQHGGAPNEQGHSTSYFHLGIRRWGRKVLAHLLDRKNLRGEPVRRILIDTKHMSPQARLEYYEIVDQRRTHFNDVLPIVASHTAVSGRASLRDSIAHSTSSSTNFEVRGGDKAASRFFHDGVINLFDDEIERIVASDGIIGLMIDERRIMGREIPPEAGISKARFDALSKANKALLREWTDIKQRHAWGEVDDAVLASALQRIDSGMKPLLDGLRPAYLSVILRQLFHIVALPGVGAKGWDHVGLGTDYDGVINPIDIYKQSSDMCTLHMDLVNFWNECLNSSDSGVKDLYTKHLHGHPPDHWMSKLLWGNGMDFLHKYFNDAYLLRGRISPS